jgi:hypothetical protein
VCYFSGLKIVQSKLLKNVAFVLVHFILVGSFVSLARSEESVIWAKQLSADSSAACNSENDIPLAVLRESYFGRQRNLECTLAADAVISYGCYKIEDELRKGLPESETIAQYRSKCLRTFASLVDTDGRLQGDISRHDHLLLISSNEQLMRLRNSVGALNRSGNKLFCSAALVAYDDKSVGLLTAVHCLGKTLDQDNGKSFKFLQQWLDVTFTSLSGQEVNITVPNVLKGKTFLKSSDDVAMIPIPNLNHPNYVPLAHDEINLWEPLVIIGASPYLAFASQAKTLEDKFAVSIEPYCVLMGREASGAIHHQCQTTRGQSGSPIVVVRGGAFAVAGVHTRSNGLCDELKTFECAKGSMLTLNAGIAVRWP